MTKITAARAARSQQLRDNQERVLAVKRDSALYRTSALAFGAFFLFTLWAFWPSYFSRPLSLPDVRFQAHGLSMTLWCLLLIGQGTLIRANRRPLHRQLGKLSYVLVPAVVVSSVSLMHFRMQGAPLTSLNLFSLALVLNALVVFVAIYGLAMSHRREAPVHARYMVCTLFPLFTPVTDRLIFAHYQPVLAYVPWLDGSPLAPVAGFVLADLILVMLSVWDWQSNKRANVFPVALGLLVAYHASVLTFHRIPLWRTFGEWFVRL